MTPIECQKDVIKTQYPLVTVEIVNMPTTTSVMLNTGVIMPTVGLGISDPCIRDAGQILLSNRHLEIPAGQVAHTVEFA